jgi:hypothetical protein
MIQYKDKTIYKAVQYDGQNEEEVIKLDKWHLRVSAFNDTMLFDNGYSLQDIHKGDYVVTNNLGNTHICSTMQFKLTYEEVS